MLQFLLDTDHLTLFQYKHPPLMRQIAAHPPGSLGISPISIEETLRGRLAVLSRALSGVAHIQAYAHLVAAVQMCSLPCRLMRLARGDSNNCVPLVCAWELKI